MKYNIVLAYINYELHLLVFSVFREQSLIVYDRFITKQDLSKQVDYEVLRKELQDAFDIVESKFSHLNKNVFVLLDVLNNKQTGSVNNETQSASFTFNFDKKQQLTREDLAEINQTALNRSVARNNKLYGGCLIEGYKVDGGNQKHVLGSVVHQRLEVKGALNYIDSRLYELFKSLVDQIGGISGFKIQGFYVADYIFKKSINLDANCGIIEIGRRSCKFTINVGGRVSTVVTEIGLVNLFNNTYDTLLKKHSKEASLEATNFIKKHFIVNKYDHDYMINDEVSVNEAANVFRNVVINYFNHFVKELKANNLMVDNFYLIINGYDESEVAAVISENTEINCSRFEVRNLLNTAEFSNVDELACLNEVEFLSSLLMHYITTYRYWEMD